MNIELFENLLRKGEGGGVDFKEQHYFKNNGTDINEKKEKTHDFVKDILCFANTVREESAYIIIGVKKIDGIWTPLGINHSESIDGAILQQKIMNKVYPIPKFEVYNFDYKGKYFEIIEIPVIWYDRYCMPTLPMKGIEVGKVYIRRGELKYHAIELHGLGV